LRARVIIEEEKRLGKRGKSPIWFFTREGNDGKEKK